MGEIGAILGNKIILFINLCFSLIFDRITACTYFIEKSSQNLSGKNFFPLIFLTLLKFVAFP